MKRWGRLGAALLLGLGLRLSLLQTSAPVHPPPRRPPPAVRMVTRVTRRGPLHLVISRRRERLKVFRADGRLLFTCRVKNDCVNLGFFHFGACPPGTYGLSPPVPIGTPAYGPYFIRLRDLSPDGPFHQYHRHGIGLHGGGSGLPEPLSRWQGWCLTEGCWRLQNHDLLELVPLVRADRRAGHHPTITIQ